MFIKNIKIIEKKSYPFFFWGWSITNLLFSKYLLVNKLLLMVIMGTYNRL